MMTANLVAFAIGVVVLGVIIKILTIPFRLFWKFITNSIVGAIMLWIVTLLGIPVKINIISSLIAGILGVPGVLIIILYTYL